MKSSAHFQKRADSSPNVGASPGWFGDARENFQQRALARPVSSDDADHFARFDLERNVSQGPNGALLGVIAAIQRMPCSCAQPPKRSRKGIRDGITDRPIGLALSDLVLLGESFTANSYVGHAVGSHQVSKSFLHPPVVIQ